MMDHERKQNNDEDHLFPASTTVVSGVLARLGLDRKPADLNQTSMEELERQPDWQVRLRVVQLLRWKGEPSTEVLKKAVTDQNKLVRMMARYLLQDCEGVAPYPHCGIGRGGPA
jgi:hypothetical protein